MATRSRIGIVNEDGTTITSIYCHNDGYPEYNGKILVENYDTREKIMALMDLGDLSSLGPTLGEAHDFNVYNGNVCTAYGRDRGEEGTEALVCGCETDYRLRDEEYNYLFKSDGKWYMAKHDGKFKPLLDVLWDMNVLLKAVAPDTIAIVPDSQWIKSLREQVEEGNDAGDDVWAPVEIALPLGYARRLLHLLDLERGHTKRSPGYRDDNQELLDELHLLATGAMEG